MNETGKELMRLLKEIYDNQDFVCGAMSNAGGEDAWIKMRDYILYAKANKLDVSSDDLLLLSLDLGENGDAQNESVDGKNEFKIERRGA